MPRVNRRKYDGQRQKIYFSSLEPPKQRTDDDGLIEVYDVILDIEMEEEMKSPNKMTERAVHAANILSAIGE